MKLCEDMRNTLPSIGSLLVLGLCLFSLHAEAQRFSLGFRVSPQFTGLLNSQDANSFYVTQQSTNGLEAGLQVHVKLSKMFKLETGILYSSEGQNQQIRDTARGFNSYNFALSYLKVPLLLQYYRQISPDVIFRVSFGPEFALRIAATQQRDNKTQVFEGLLTGDLYKPVDFRLAGGAGFDFKLRPKLVLNTGVRFDYGLTDVEQKSLIWKKNQLYYNTYFADGKPRTAATHAYTLGFTIGILYTLDFHKEGKEYYW